MKLTFAIPAYNEAKNIGRCLDSIMHEVEKGSHRDNIEIIVVDNACTDTTAEIAKKYNGVTVVSEPNKGLLFARQRGYLSATGDLIANVDADTALSPGWINTVFKEFSNDNELVALSGPFVFEDLTSFEKLLVALFYRIGFVFHILHNNFFHTGARMLQGGNFVLRKSAMDQLGGFDLSIDFYGEDTDIARRISSLGKVKFNFQFPIFTSERRLRAEGILLTGVRYAINHFWILIFKKPFTKKYRDVRL